MAGSWFLATYSVWHIVLGISVSCKCSPSLVAHSSSIVLYQPVSTADVQSTTVVLVKYGHAGHHVVTASKAQINRWLKISVAEGYIYFPSTSFPKLAFLCLYLKIFTKKPYRYATFATIGVIVVSNIAFIITSAVDCPSSAYAWHTTGTSERCGDLLVMYRWASMPNLATDFVTILLPLPVTWHLHMTRAQKMGLTITFMIGCT